MTIEFLSLAISIISVVVAVIQTFRLRNVKTFRNHQLKDIWRSQKGLSWWLLVSTENDHPRRLCGEKSQEIEHSIARLMASLSGWKRKELDKLQNEGIIDDHDNHYLKRILE